jgi:hypothetical protein
MPGRPTANQELQRQELLSRIARVRRRMDRRLAKLADRALAPHAWGRYVRRRPGRSLLAAFGIGLVLSRWLSPRRTVRGLSHDFEDLAAETAWRWLRRLWFRLAAGRAPTARRDGATEADHE